MRNSPDFSWLSAGLLSILGVLALVVYWSREDEKALQVTNRDRAVALAPESELVEHRKIIAAFESPGEEGKAREPGDAFDKNQREWHQSDPNAGSKANEDSTAEAPDIEWPENIENQIWGYFSQVSGLALTSISSVECNQTTCEVVITGNDIDPKYVDEYMELPHGMYKQGWNVQQSSMSLREIAPGVKAYVLRISNVRPAIADGPTKEDPGRADKDNDERP